MKCPALVHSVVGPIAVCALPTPVSSAVAAIRITAVRIRVGSRSRSTTCIALLFLLPLLSLKCHLSLSFTTITTLPIVILSDDMFLDDLPIHATSSTIDVENKLELSDKGLPRGR